MHRILEPLLSHAQKSTRKGTLSPFCGWGDRGLARPARRLGCCNSESQVNPLPSLLPILPQSSILSGGPALPFCSKASRSSDLRIKHGPLPDPLKSPPWLLSPHFSSPSPAQESFYPLAQGPLSVLWRPECPALRTVPTADAQVSIVDGRKEGKPAQAPHFLPCAWRGPLSPSAPSSTYL